MNGLIGLLRWRLTGLAHAHDGATGMRAGLGKDMMSGLIVPVAIPACLASAGLARRDAAFSGTVASSAFHLEALPGDHRPDRLYADAGLARLRGGWRP